MVGRSNSVRVFSTSSPGTPPAAFCWTASFFLLVLTQGCSTVAVRPGVTQVNDAVEQWVSDPADEVGQAAQRVFIRRGYLLMKGAVPGASRYKVIARDVQGTEYVISIQYINPEATRYTVQINPGRDINARIILAESILQELEEARRTRPMEEPDTQKTGLWKVLARSRSRVTRDMHV